MSRPEVEGIDFVDHVHLGVVELLARQDAVCSSLSEQGHRDHERAGEVKGM
jgi:hypothetical protein